MVPDFSGYATRNDIVCTDGRTIKSGAFKHHDQQKVPLVWHHQHSSPENVLGHVMLENRADGVYAYGFFNDTEPGQHAKQLVKHGDVKGLSIFANSLVERSKNVMHGNLVEVSLVLAGANSGAFIDNINLAHSDGSVVTLDDEAIIFADEPIEPFVEEVVAHAETAADSIDATNSNEPLVSNETTTDAEQDSPPAEDAEKEDQPVDEIAHADTADETLDDIFETLNEKQKNLFYLMVGAVATSDDDTLQQSAVDINDASANETDEGKTLAHNQEEGTTMTRNVFEQNGLVDGPTLSHDQLKTIVEDAQKMGSFKDAFLAHAAEYGIEDIDILFPDAKALTNSPDIIGRRTEWVADVINGTKHSPFSRIKSVAADITADEARAKGYVKGNLKKDEVIKLLKRVTVPTTIYKKQKLDRDDIIDITDLDVVAWLKAEMRLMLDEELGRAVLIGDGRESDDEDKIDEDHIRPIADDNDMYAHQLVVGGELAPSAIVESVLRARTYYKGTGTPNFYTTDGILTDLILQTDKVGRRLYETEAALAAALRVGKIVTVEVMNDRPDIVGILVNLADYTLGADRGGAVSMFDDFDIDYNQYKYLIETRVSGALTKPKSALVIKRTLGTIVSPTSPSYNGATHELTFPAIAGVVYSIDGVTQTGTVTIEETVDVEARPATGYSFPANTVRDWTYVYTA